MAGSEMCSSISLDDDGWRRIVRVFGLPPGATADELEELFEDGSVGGPIDMICMTPGSSMAEITFEDEKDAERVASKKTFEYKGSTLTLKKLSHPFGNMEDTEDSLSDGDKSMDSFIILPYKEENRRQNEMTEDVSGGQSLIDILTKSLSSGAKANDEGKMQLESRSKDEDSAESTYEGDNKDEVNDDDIDDDDNVREDSSNKRKEEMSDDQCMEWINSYGGSREASYSERYSEISGNERVLAEMAGMNLSSGDRKEPEYSIVVFNIPEELTTDDIVAYFESKVGEVKKRQEFNGAQSIVLTFETDGKELHFGEHMFMSKKFSVRPLDRTEEVFVSVDKEACPDTSSNPDYMRRVVVARIPKDVAECDLAVLFGSQVHGGGPIESVDIKDTDTGRNAVVTFKDFEVAENLLEKGKFMILKHEVKLMPYKARNEHVVEVVGVEDENKGENLTYFFESSRNQGGRIEHIDFDHDRKVFILRFFDSKVSRSLVGRSFEYDNMCIQVQWPSLEDPKEEWAKSLTEHTQPKCQENKKIVEVHGWSEPPNIDGLLYFFESSRNNGGSIENIKYNEMQKTVTIEFQDENVAQNLLGKEFVIEGSTVTVRNTADDGPDLVINEQCAAEHGARPKKAKFHEPDESSNHHRRTGQKTNSRTDQIRTNKEGESPKLTSGIRSQKQDRDLIEEERKLAEMECTVRVKLPGEIIKKDTLKRYAKKAERSGGGPIKDFRQLSNDSYEIVFKDPQDAARFLSKRHSIENQEVLVQPLASSDFHEGDCPLEQLEPRKLLVKWTAGCTVSHDDLLYYLMEICSDDLKISYVPKPNTAMVELPENWDAASLKRRLKITPFMNDGSVNLIISPLKKPTCVSLPKLKLNDALKMSLPLYFENPQKGGDENCKLDYSSGIAIVKCPDNLVAERLANKRHNLGYGEFSAELIYEEIGVIPVGFDRDCAFIELPSHTVIDNLGDKWKFFTSDLTVSYANSLLDEVHAKLEPVNEKGSRKLKIKCLIKKGMEGYQNKCRNWEAEVKKIISNIAEGITVTRVKALEKTWKPLKEMVVQRLPYAPMCVINFDDAKTEIELVGLEDEVMGIKKTIEKAVQEVTKDLQSIEHEEEYKRLQLKCLIRNGFLDKARKMTNIKIDDGSSRNSLTFKGNGKDVLEVSRLVRKEIESLHEEQLKVTHNVSELMNSEVFVEKFLAKEKLQGVVVEVTGKDKVSVVGVKDLVETAKTAFKTSIGEFLVFFRTESEALIGKKEWHALLKKAHEKVGDHMFSYHVSTKDLRIEFASSSEDKSFLKKHFINFFNYHTAWEERVALSDSKLQIIIKEYEQKIKSIPEKIGSNQASINVSRDAKRKGLIIKGNQNNLKKMRSCIDEILQDLHLHKETVTGAGAKALTQETGKYFRRSLEQDCNVLVEVVHGNSKNGYVTEKNGVTVKVQVGTMDECVADVLVDPANEDLKHGGGLAKVLADSGGQIVNSDSLFSVKAFGKVKVGEVRATSGGMLPCKVLYHTVGPQFKNGQTDKNSEGELHSATIACLERAAKEGYCTIALPLISAGQFGGPMHVVARIMVKAIDDYITSSGRQGSLREIIVIDFDQKKIDEFAKAVQGRLGGAYPKLAASRPSASKETAGYAPESKDVSNRIVLSMDEMKSQKVEVIINSVPQDGDLHQGALSKSIMECLDKKDQKTIQDQVKLGAPLGENHFISSDGGGRWLAIYHCRLGGWDGGSAKEGLKNLVIELLKSASKSQYRSIAIPAIGTGYLGFPHDVVAVTLYKTAKEFLEKHPGSLEKVVFVVHAKDDKSAQAFKRVFSGNYQDQSSDDTILKGKVLIGAISFEVLQADITKETTECIVNGTNDKLDLQIGLVSKAIINAAGNSVVQECKQKGSVGSNGTIMTGAGNLKNRKICHLNVGHNNFSIKENIKSCLQECENYHLKSISFPALGTGQLKNDPKEMAGITMEAIAEFTKNEPKYVREIRLCIFEKKFLDVYHEEMQRVVVQGRKSAAGWRKKVKAVFTDTFNSVFGRESKKSSNGASSGMSLTYTSTPVAHDIELLITYLDPKDKNEALKRIKEFCQSQEKTVMLGGWQEKEMADVVKKLDSFKKYQLEAEAEKHGVSMKMDSSKGSLEVKGHEKDVGEFVMKAHNILFAARKELQEEEGAEMLAQFISWEFEHKGNYVAYPNDINMDIEKAYKEKKDRVSWDEDRGGGKKEKITVYFKYNVEEDESKKKTKIRRHDLRGDSVELPKDWAPMDNKNDKKFLLVPLQSSSPEYQKVENAFKKDVPNLKIVKIDRIQNPGLYQSYIVRKQNMKNPNEKHLWHGTSSDVVQKIMANGFNRSYCGLHGIKYGHGVYFAPNANYPVSFHQGNYSTPDKSGNSFLFYNRVLVGEYTWGNKDYKEPPPKDPKNPLILYDSCVNNMKKIDEFVIFKDNQCYPDFLLTYKLR